MRWLRICAILLFCLAPLLLIGLLLLLFWLSISELSGDLLSRSLVGVANYVTVLHTYIFRNAVKNSFLVAAAVSVLAPACAWPLARRLQQAGRDRSFLLFVLLLPAATPVALAGIAWRELTAPLVVAMHTPAIGLAVVAAAHAWRLIPVAVCLFIFFPGARLRVVIGLTMIGLFYLVIADAGIVLLLTAGEPFNATQLWASWIFQQGIGAGRMGGAAAMAVLLIPLLALLALTGLTLLRILTRDPMARQPSEARRMGTAGRLMIIPILLYLIAPYMALLMQIGWPQRWPVYLARLFGATDFLWWAANSLLLISVAAAAGAFFFALTHSYLTGRDRSIGREVKRALLLTALLAWPLIYLSGVWLHGRLAIPDRRFTLVILYMAILICGGVGLALVDEGRSRNILRLFALAIFVVMQDFGLALGLEGPSRSLDLSAGIVRRMGAGVGDGEPMLAAAILTTVGLLTVFGLLVRYGVQAKAP